MADNEKKPGPGSKPLFSAGGLILMLVILVLVNVIFSGLSLRWDATEENLFSLSDGTKQILDNLKQDVTIKVFYTRENDNMPLPIRNYAGRMLDFLKEYENYTGKVKIEVFNPEPDSEEEEWAEKYGIEGMDVPGGDRIFFGLVAIAADQEEAIPTLDPTREEQLEYDITRIISRVQSARKPKIGIISTLPVFGSPPMPMMGQPGGNPWFFISELKKTYDVQEIGTSEDKIDDDVNVLMLIHPKDLSDSILYAVDQYVLKGGSLIVFADGFCMSDTARTPSKSSDLKKLFDVWGVKTEPGKVLVDFDYTTKLRNQQNQAEDNPLWVSLRADAFNRKNIITGQLESILMPVAGVFSKAPDSTVDYEPLIQSSTNSALTESFRLQFGSSADQLRRDFKATPDQYDIAVRLQGKFKTAFPDGKPESEDKDGAENADKKPSDEKGLTQGEKKATIVIVGDADMLFDGYYVNQQNFMGFRIARMFNDNLNFLLNADEVLTGSEALISIRSRGKFDRPFTTVQELEKKAQARWFAREQELVARVEATNTRLRELEQQKDASQKMLVSAQQEEEIRKFQDEKRRINKELKEVRRNLRADIEFLGSTIKFINIFLAVFLVIAVGVIHFMIRRKKSLG